MVEYTVQKSKRKTISILVKADGAVVVKAPLQASAGQIGQMVDAHTDWICQKQQEMKLRQARQVIHQYTEGESFLFLGQRLSLVIRHDAYLRKADVQVSEEDAALVVTTSITDGVWIREALLQWYYEQAVRRFDERTKYFAEKMQKNYGRITVRNQSSRWGSCSVKGNLNYNYRLIMAPPEILDYVVVHELCHLTHMDHSAQFWNAVAEALPDYGSRRSWLKKNGHLLGAL